MFRNTLVLIEPNFHPTVCVNSTMLSWISEVEYWLFHFLYIYAIVILISWEKKDASGRKEASRRKLKSEKSSTYIFNI